MPSDCAYIQWSSRGRGKNPINYKRRQDGSFEKAVKSYKSSAPSLRHRPIVSEGYKVIASSDKPEKVKFVSDIDEVAAFYYPEDPEERRQIEALVDKIRESLEKHDYAPFYNVNDIISSNGEVVFENFRFHNGKREANHPWLHQYVIDDTIKMALAFRDLTNEPLIYCSTYRPRDWDSNHSLGMSIDFKRESMNKFTRQRFYNFIAKFNFKQLPDKTRYGLGDHNHADHKKTKETKLKTNRNLYALYKRIEHKKARKYAEIDQKAVEEAAQQIGLLSQKGKNTTDAQPTVLKNTPTKSQQEQASLNPRDTQSIQEEPLPLTKERPEPRHPEHTSLTPRAKLEQLANSDKPAPGNDVLELFDKIGYSVDSIAKGNIPAIEFKTYPQVPDNFSKNKIKNLFVLVATPQIVSKIDELKPKLSPKEKNTILMALLAQGARESTWGKGEKSKEYKNLFGLKDFDSEKATINYDSIGDSVEAYLTNLFDTERQETFIVNFQNKLKELSVKEGKPELLDSLALIAALQKSDEESENYSEDEDYVDEIWSIMLEFPDELKKVLLTQVKLNIKETV